MKTTRRFCLYVAMALTVASVGLLAVTLPAGAATKRPSVKLVGTPSAALTDDKMAVIVSARVRVDRPVKLTIIGTTPGGSSLVFGSPATGPTTTLQQRVARAGVAHLKLPVPVMRNHLVSGQSCKIRVVATAKRKRSTPLVFAFRVP